MENCCQHRNNYALWKYYSFQYNPWHNVKLCQTWEKHIKITVTSVQTIQFHSLQKQVICILLVNIYFMPCSWVQLLWLFKTCEFLIKKPSLSSFTPYFSVSKETVPWVTKKQGGWENTKNVNMYWPPTKMFIIPVVTRTSPCKRLHHKNRTEEYTKPAKIMKWLLSAKRYLLWQEETKQNV